MLIALLSLVLLTLPARAAEFDKYGGYVAIKSQKPSNGYFTVEKIGNRWWFITPAGHAFVALSVSGVSRSPSDGTDRDGKGYKDYVPIKYGEGGGNWARRWEQAAIDRLSSWGFNTIGTFSYGVQDLKRMPFYQTLRLSNYAVIKDGPVGNIWTETGGGAFPDIYHPQFQTFIDQRMQGFAAGKDNPWVLGLFVDQMDELRGFDGSHIHLGWGALVGKRQIKRADKQPVDNYYKSEFIRFLGGRYKGDVAALNAAWGTEYASFDAIQDQGVDEKFGKGNDPQVAGHPKFREDLDAFEQKVAADYTRMIITTVRKHDPNHLILSPNMGFEAKATVVRGFVEGGGFDVYVARWGGESYDMVKRPIVGAKAGYLTADHDSPLRFEGRVTRCEIVDDPKHMKLVKCWTDDMDIWWEHAGNPLRMSFRDVPAPDRQGIDSAALWDAQMLKSGKEQDGTSWFLVRPRSPYRTGTADELVQQIKLALEKGATPRFERFSYGGCKTQNERAEKWRAALHEAVTEKSPSGDYFRIGQNWWKYSDNGWTYWLERYNFGLVTQKDNAYDGKQATRLGADGKAGTWDDEAGDYGDLLTGVTQANKGIYERILKHDGSASSTATR
jgi:hypothetical protein